MSELTVAEMELYNAKAKYIEENELLILFLLNNLEMPLYQGIR